VPKASDVLADELRERILSGDFAEGTGLPPERVLVTQTGLSRTTVREALRILEVQGLVRIKAGRTGGAFVQQPGEDAMSKTVDHIIRGRQIRHSALLETREAIEPHCARLAAKNRSAAQLADLERANTALEAAGGNLDQLLESSVDWHVAVARASNNELLSGLMIALSRALYEGSNDETFVDAALGSRAARAHVAVTAAIRDQDEEAAARMMAKHVHAYAGEVMARDDHRDVLDIP
jgi:GntR family transcriptional repressor for pyruvate dehydrogenase complex